MAGRAATLIVLAAFAATPVRADDDQATALSGVGVSLPKSCLGPREPPDLGVPAPKLLSTYPAEAQVVRPGLLILRVTFDLPMACWPNMTKPAVMETSPADTCATFRVQHWVLLKERVHWTILCHLAPKTHYSVRLKAFKGLSGRQTAPYAFVFETSDEAPVSTMKEAFDLSAPARPGAPTPPPQAQDPAPAGP